MICENCNKEYFEDYRKHPNDSPSRFCSLKCAKQYNGKKNKGVLGHPCYSKQDLRENIIEKYKIDTTNLICSFCNKPFLSLASLCGHITQCSQNPSFTKKPKSEKWKIAMQNRKVVKQNHNPDNFVYYCSFCGRSFNRKESKTLHEKYCTKNVNREEHPRKGEVHTEEQNLKNRIAVIKKYTDLGLKFCPNISLNGCNYADFLNQKFGWNLQHGLNGGEVEIDGYFPDGYDKEKNIIFEYDEPFHYLDPENNILTEKDIKRQNYLIEKLNCDFYRYNEKKDYFYKVN